MTSVLGFLFCKMLVISLGRRPEPCISLSPPSCPPLLPTLQAHTPLSSFHHPAIQPGDEVTPLPFGWRDMVMVWEKKSGYESLEVSNAPDGLSLLLDLFYFVSLPRIPWQTSSSPYPAVVVPLLSISPGGFQVAAAFAQGRGFPKHVTLATRNFSPAKTPPRTSRLQRARRWASIYHFLQRKNAERGRWCLPSWQHLQWNRLVPRYLHLLIFLATPL